MHLLVNYWRYWTFFSSLFTGYFFFLLRVVFVHFVLHLLESVFLIDVYHSFHNTDTNPSSFSWQFFSQPLVFLNYMLLWMHSLSLKQNQLFVHFSQLKTEEYIFHWDTETAALISAWWASKWTVMLWCWGVEMTVMSSR